MKQAALHIGPPLWALFFLLVAASANLLYPWRTVFDLSSRPLGALCILVGAGVAGWSLRLFVRYGTTVIPDDPVNKALVESGPYARSRNPMYLSLLLIALGVAFLVGTPPFFLVPIVLFLVLNFLFIPFEEEKMLRQFGETYASYTRRVQRWL
ncbi:MAG: isoprenylcysteine carboxylmethyltransferase family protein [Hyphomicrobiales bacterium]|nr:isoprenylcysteine carboxylmethyltransferase family protein [Hyphomicrobiales bacterium]